jgi:hypothetical protein
MFLSTDKIVHAGRLEKVREKKRRYKAKKLDSAFIRLSRYCVSAIHKQRKLDSITYIQYHDGSSFSGEYYITPKELTHAFAIIFISSGAFGIGIGQLIAELVKRYS